MAQEVGDERPCQARLKGARNSRGSQSVPDNLKLLRSGMVGDLRSELFRLIRDERDAKGPRPPVP